MNVKRLLKLADGLEKVPKEVFDYDRWVSITSKLSSPKKTTFDCGFKGCAIGWAPVFFPKSGFKIVNFVPYYKGETDVDAIQDFFDITYEEVYDLFVFPHSYKNEVPHTTPKMVARAIRKFVKEHD